MYNRQVQERSFIEMAFKGTGKETQIILLDVGRIVLFDEPVLFVYDAVTVSYTHLDVYKRQGVTCAICPVCELCPFCPFIYFAASSYDFSIRATCSSMLPLSLIHI